MFMEYIFKWNDMRCCFVTALKQSAIRGLKKSPEDKISFILQKMQGENNLYNDNQSQRKEFNTGWTGIWVEFESTDIKPLWKWFYTDIICRANLSCWMF